MKRNIIPLVFALVLMASCSSLHPSPVSTAAPTTIVMIPDQASPTPSVQEKKIQIPSFNPVNGKDGALIPVCNNSNTPSPLSDVDVIEGDIIYRNHKNTEWFLLAGKPPFVQTINPLRNGTDSVKFSENGNWMLMYSQVPNSTGLENQYPIWLISADGKEREVLIDISFMVSIEKDQLCSTCHFLGWTIAWQNEKIIRVRASFGESAEYLYPDYIYGDFDIEQEVWWEGPVKKIANRTDYDWYDYSTDFSRMLFTAKNLDFVLWDVEAEKELWKMPAGSNQLPPYAAWSFKNNWVAFWTDNKPLDIQLLSRDGSYYEVVPKPFYEDSSLQFAAYRGFFEWAPDREQLAISGRIMDSQGYSIQTMLYIYDVDLKKYVYSCPMGDVNEGTISSSVIWSPDGNYILPEIYQSKTTPFNLYDIENSIVYQILPPGYAGVAWLKSFPDRWR